MKTKENMVEWIKKQKTAFIGSVDEDGFPNIKAVFSPGKIEGDSFYFSTNTSSLRAQQFLKKPKASLYFYRRDRFKYEGLMLVGTVEILHDIKIKEELWHPGDIIYYKLGVTDPDYCVLKFTATKGRYYCNLKTESFHLADLK